MPHSVPPAARRLLANSDRRLTTLAALTNAARVSGREHWFSDTVAGAALGYVIGDRMLGANLDESDEALRVSVGVGRSR